MSNISDLRITVNNVNDMLERLGRDERVRITRSYGNTRLEIDMPSGSFWETKPRGAKDCLMYAEGMERLMQALTH